MKVPRKSLILLLVITVSGIAQEEKQQGEKTSGPESPKGPRSGERGERPRKGPPRDGFMFAYDRNRDGKVSYEEFGSVERTAALKHEGRRRLFDHLDKNKDGVISPGELPKSAPKPVRDGDLNKDGKISMEEFRRNSRLRGIGEERISAMFSRMDRNKDGVLTSKDFRRRAISGPEQVEMKKLDVNGDGALSFEEWSRSPRHKEVSLEELKRRFKMLDQSKDGKIDGKERDRFHRRREGVRQPGKGGSSPERTK